MICYGIIGKIQQAPREYSPDAQARTFLQDLNQGRAGVWLGGGIPSDLLLSPLRHALQQVYRMADFGTETAAWNRNPMPGYDRLIPSIPACYRDAVKASVREMRLERDQVRELTGDRPLSSLEKGLLEYWDAGVSLDLFIRQDVMENRGLVPPSKQGWLGPDDPQPYTPDEVDVATFLRAERIAERRKKLAELVGAGQAGDYSQIVTDQLTNPIALDPLYPVIGPENRDIAAEQDPVRRALLAMRQARDIDLQALAVETQKLETAAQVRRFWEGNYPGVELKAEDNPHIDPALLVRDWWSNAYPLTVLWSPPTVKLLVTPRTKPLPDMNWLGGIGGSILSTVLGFIPVIGTAASFAVSQAQKGIQNKFVSSALNGLPQSVFAPQYYPEPFHIALPLDEAQAAVKDPSFVPALAWRFRDQTGGLANPFQ